MVERVESLSAAIGTRVRSARVRRGWTLDQLAQSAGVSRRMVVNVEQGASNPSVGTLLKLGEALGVGLPALVEVDRPGAVVVTRAGAGPVLWRGERGGSGVMVAGVDASVVLELWEWRLQAGERRVSEAHVPGTQELLHVLEGSLRLQVAEDVALLGAGDAAAFAGDVDHAYVHAGEGPTRFSMTVFEPAPSGGRRRG